MERSNFLQSIVLVTGGRGLLGSRVVPLLSQNDPRCEIITIVRNEEQGRENSSQVTTILGDLRDENLWARIPQTITHVFHLAAVIPWRADDRNRASVVTDNVLPLAHLIEQSQRWPNLRQVIYGSSVSVYAQTGAFLSEDSPRHPQSLYGASKLAGEDLVCCLEARGVRTVSLRFSSLYGYGQYQGTVLPIMVGRAAKRENIVIFGDGTRTQDFVHCEDAARALFLCFEKEAAGVYNIGAGTPVTMTELAQTVSRIFSDGDAKLIYHLTKGDGDPGIRLDISKARRELNYEPGIQLQSGLRKLKKEMENAKP